MIKLHGLMDGDWHISLSVLSAAEKSEEFERKTCGENVLLFINFFFKCMQASIVLTIECSGSKTNFPKIYCTTEGQQHRLHYEVFYIIFSYKSGTWEKTNRRIIKRTYYWFIFSVRQRWRHYTVKCLMINLQQSNLFIVNEWAYSLSMYLFFV